MRVLLALLLLWISGVSYAAVPTPNNSAQPQQASAAQETQEPPRAIESAQNRIAEATNTGEYQQPCDETQPNNRSDLCAQWYAARAARDAANWAWWGLLVGGIGAVGIVVALLLTIESNRIARSTARHQLRAYLSSADVSADPIPFDDGEKGLAFRAVWKNAGQTPAHDVCASLVARVFETREEALASLVEWPELGPERTVVGPGLTFGTLVWRLRMSEFRSGSTLMASRVTYLDVFSNETRESEMVWILEWETVAEDRIAITTPIISARAT